MEIIWIDKTESTNSYIRNHLSSLKPGSMVIARQQTAGRGQRGNSWESEPYKNLTFSILLPELDIRPTEQFVISEAAALAIVSTLSDFGIPASVKWPNDIYVSLPQSNDVQSLTDRKICGILIENSIMGNTISSSIAGIGLNVNQEVFTSDAPNPVSMKQITGRDYDLKAVADTVASRIQDYFGEIRNNPASLHSLYLEKLWRNDGRNHRFVDISTGRELQGVIDGVELTGHLRLKTDEGVRKFAFKEIAFVI